MARKTYTREFKLQALRMITEQRLSVAAAQRRLQQVPAVQRRNPLARDARLAPVRPGELAADRPSHVRVVAQVHRSEHSLIEPIRRCERL